MPMYRVLLHKCSLPNAWTKEFASVNEARKELLKHICRECIDGEISYVGGRVISREPPNIYEIEELLGTPCGLEFEMEEFD